MRTCGSTFVATNFTFEVFAQAFMCRMIRFCKSSGGLSRKPTVRLTPCKPQYLVVNTAMRSGVATKSGITPVNRCNGVWLRGFTSTAVLAAAMAFSSGKRFGVHTREIFTVDPFVCCVIAAAKVCGDSAHSIVCTHTPDAG